MDGSTREPDQAAVQSLSVTDKEEKRDRETEWGNEGGCVRKDEPRKPAAAVVGGIANDNGADAD